MKQKNSTTETDQRKFAERYWTAQAQKILDLFQAVKGKPAQSVPELEQWVKTPQGKAALARHHDKNGKIDPFSKTNVSGL